VPYKKDLELDLEFYRETYLDLSHFNDSQLYEHWFNFGKNEGRVPNNKNLDFELDFEFYLLFYPDLPAAGFRTINQAKTHWLRHGRYEKRFHRIDEWEDTTGLTLLYDPTRLDIANIIKRNLALNVTFSDLLELLTGSITKPISVFEDPVTNSDFYKELGDTLYLCFLEKSKDQSAKENEEVDQSSIQLVKNLLHSSRSAWKHSLYFHQTPELWEQLGNIFFKTGDFNSAITFYEEALRVLYEPGYRIKKNLRVCYEKLASTEKKLDNFIQRFVIGSSFAAPEEEIEICVQRFFDAAQSKLDVHAINDKRTLLKREYFDVAKEIYNFWFNFFGGCTGPLKRNLNTEKILIVGDYHVPQCVRYRIDQKVEQLEVQGKTVTTIDWLQLEKKQTLIAQHDVVIFYRVPAVPHVLKAMALVNANGKASFYEIDDLLFEESYPTPIETFGGYVGLDVYFELKKGMASFNAAARHCRYGIASTHPLCEKLKGLVFDGECILHRNGVDKMSVIEFTENRNKSTTDIFFGSGTLAHNSDFMEEALPALRKILRNHQDVRLIIAGYLKLPEDFLSEYKSQLVCIPPINQIEAYWAFLSKADINLAVLKDDVINGCKSEIKWLEAACFGIPSIVSNTQNYQDVLCDREDAFIAKNEEEWLIALDTLIINRVKRRELGERAFSKMHSEYSIKSLGKSLVKQFDKILNVSLAKVRKKKVRKKLAIVNVFFPPKLIGGATRVVSDNFDVLRSEYGDDFDLVVFTSDVEEREPYKLSAYQYKGVTVYRTSIQYRVNMDWHPKDEFMGALFKQFLKLEKPDLIHFHCVQRLSASTLQVAKEKNIPYLVTVHDAWWISDHQFLVDENDKIYLEGHPDIFEPKTLPEGISLGDSISRLLYLKELLLGAKILLTVSEGFAEIYKKNGFPDTRVTKNGLSSSVNWKMKDTRHTEKVVCAMIGGMANHKGYYLFREAAENIQPLNIEILIVDLSQEPDYCLRESWGDVPVTFIGRVDHAKIVGLYQKIDVLYAPSMWPESFGLVTREAAACGCWVVASDIGGIGEDIIDGKTGFKIKPERSAIEDSLVLIDSDVERYKGISPAVNVRMVEEQVRELVEIYND